PRPHRRRPPGGGLFLCCSNHALALRPEDLLDQAGGQLHHVVLVVAWIRAHPGIPRGRRRQSVCAVVAHVVGVAQVAARQMLSARPAAFGPRQVATVFALGLAAVLPVLVLGLAAILLVLALRLAALLGHFSPVLPRI